MKNFILFFTIIISSFYFVQAQENWEHLGTLDIADVKKIVKDKSRYYALTTNGIYMKADKESTWVLIDGSSKLVVSAGISLKDFYVSDENIYLIFTDDASTIFIIVSNDYGDTWKNAIGGLSGIENVKVAGDTIQFRTYEHHYYSIDGLKNYNTKRLRNFVPSGNDLDLFDLKYVMTSNGSLHFIDDTYGLDYGIEYGPKLFDLPQGYKFIQLIDADSLVFVWATDQKEYVLFRINPVTKQYDKNLVFVSDENLKNSVHTYYSTYFKYDENVLSMVTNEYYGHDVSYVSYDLGQTWQISSSFPNTYKEYFGDEFWINPGTQLYSSIDNGVTLEPQGKGISTLNNYNISNYNSDIYIEYNYKYFKNLPLEKRFTEVEYLSNYDWDADSDNTIYVIKDKKLWRWNEEIETLEGDYAINTDNEIFSLHIANDIIFVTTKNSMQYSIDKGLSWFDTQQKFYFSQIIFHNGTYYMNQNLGIYKSTDLKIWTLVNVKGNLEFKTGYLWVIDDELYLRPEHSFMFGKYDDEGDFFDIDRGLPFYFIFHNSDSSTGLAMIDTSRIIAYKINKGLKFSGDGGYHWEELDDFKNSIISDVKVIDGYIYVLDMFGLWRRSVDYLDTAVKTETPSTSNSITISPNPTSNYLSIVTTQPTEIVSIIIFNNDGSIAYSNQDNQRLIDISALKNGMYFVQIKTDDGVCVRKMMKVE
ncbi:MAG: T9SS type A sorting domain-containing protein [Saprospiraceae bacterium]